MCSFLNEYNTPDLQRKRTCVFAVGFTTSVKEGTKCYVWKQSNVCLVHNHSLSNQAPAYNGKQIKSSTKECTKEEEMYARNFNGHTNLYVFREIMTNKFPETDFTDTLLNYMNQQGKKSIKAKGDKVDSLLSYGKVVERNGGIFEYKCDGNTRICELYIQSHTSKKYLSMYGDFLIIDGTHNTNVNAMTLMPIVVVGSFGRTRIGGYILGHHEEHETIINGLRAFGIDNDRGITLMTDSGSAQFQHVLCVYHFTRNIFGTTCKMSNDLKDLYLKDCADLVHKKLLVILIMKMLAAAVMKITIILTAAVFDNHGATMVMIGQE
jgi:hypothetical protein